MTSGTLRTLLLVGLAAAAVSVSACKKAETNADNTAAAADNSAMASANSASNSAMAANAAANDAAASAPMSSNATNAP
jgi:hypothetical protein